VPYWHVAVERQERRHWVAHQLELAKPGYHSRTVSTCKLVGLLFCFMHAVCVADVLVASPASVCGDLAQEVVSGATRLISPLAFAQFKNESTSAIPPAPVAVQAAGVITSAAADHVVQVRCSRALQQSHDTTYANSLWSRCMRKPFRMPALSPKRLCQCPLTKRPSSPFQVGLLQHFGDVRIFTSAGSVIPRVVFGLLQRYRFIFSGSVWETGRSGLCGQFHVAVRTLEDWPSCPSVEDWAASLTCDAAPVSTGDAKHETKTSAAPIPCSVSHVGNGVFAVAFELKSSAVYSCNVALLGERLPGCPRRVEVRPVWFETQLILDLYRCRLWKKAKLTLLRRFGWLVARGERSGLPLARRFTWWLLQWETLSSRQQKSSGSCLPLASPPSCQQFVFRTRNAG
jgi:hypothetical protein